MQIHPLVIDLIGYVGTVIALGACAMRSHRTMTLGIAVGLSFMAVHYAALGALTVALLNGLSAAQWASAPMALSSTPGARKLQLTCWLAAIVVAGALSWSGPVSALAIAGNVLLMVASFCCSGLRLRACMLAADGLWITIAALVGTTPGLMLSCAGAAINATMFCRLAQARVARHGASPRTAAEG